MKENQKRSVIGYLGVYVAGLIVGAANVIPGVSGGTMAFILGIYEEMLDSIRSFTTAETWKTLLTFRIKQAYRTLPWPFLLWLTLGILSASVLLAKPIKWMLEYRLPLILAFFFGLVAASVVTVLMRVSKFRAVLIPALIVGAGIGWWVAGLSEGMQSPPDAWWYLMLCGAVSICAMILPGISGSFILLLMGRYEYIMDALGSITEIGRLDENLVTLGCFGIGVVLGLASFARLLSWMFRSCRDLTIAVLAGFMIGSLRKIWPWKVDDMLERANTLPALDRNFVWALALLILGFVLVVVIELSARSHEK